MKLPKAFSSHGFRIFLTCILFFAVTGSVYAKTCEPSDWVQEPTYLGKISQKLGFGFLNLTAGWTAILFEPVKDQNFFAGVGKGMVYAVTNTAGGVLHAATFPIPLDIPLPHGGIAYEYKK